MANIRADSGNSTQRSSSLEDYLEAILLVSSKAGGETSITELGEHLGVKKPSVSNAVKKLVMQDLVEHERYGRISLTAEGRRRALDVARRHDLLVRFLGDVLCVDPSIAEEDACRLEHELSTETTEKLSQFVEFLTGGAGEGSLWNRDFASFLADGKHHHELAREEDGE